MGQTRRHIPLDFDLVVTAQQVRSYKPDPAHFTECERRIGTKKGWVHVAASYYHDIEPCLKKKIPVIWVNRTKQQLEPGQKKPDAEVATLRKQRNCSASAETWATSLRALALDADVLVFVSRRLADHLHGESARGDEGFVIDSPVYPEELRVLPGVLEQAGYPVSGLLATHGDWDHLLGGWRSPTRRSRPREIDGRAAAGRSSGRPTVSFASSTREHYVDRPAPLSLGSLQSLPVPGQARVGAGPAPHELELYPTGGHTPDGTAFWLPWCEVLVCGDYLSPVELPTISPRRLACDLPGDARPPGGPGVTGRMGRPGPRWTDLRRAGQAVLPRTAPTSSRSRAIDGDEVAALPEGRRTAAQRRLHAENLTRVRG